MDIRIKELIDFTHDKFGLENYFLKRHHLYRRVNLLNETVYLLNMEWFPSPYTDWADEDFNPDGTASIDINVNNHQFETVIFTSDECFADKVLFERLDRDFIISWVERETGLSYGKQFQLLKEEEKEFKFRSCFNGVSVSPSSWIELKVNEEGKMTFFSINGVIPSESQLKEEAFLLTLKDGERLAREQMKQIEFPSYKKKQFMQIYCLEEIYLTNDGRSTIPFDRDVGSFMKIDEVMTWEPSIKKRFKRSKIDCEENITVEQAFSCEHHPDLSLITMEDIENCLMAVRDFLNQVYPNDSGKWKFKNLHRDNGYIIADLRLIGQERRTFQRKLRLFLDRKSYKVLNYMDNESILDIYGDFQNSGDIVINKETAFLKIKSTIEVKPVYVYDSAQNRFILCGKVDSHYAVNAVNGEVLDLDKL